MSGLLGDPLAIAALVVAFPVLFYAFNRLMRPLDQIQFSRREPD